MSRLISIALLGVALVATPVYAQRGGGGRSGGSSSHSSGGSFSSSRSGGSYSSGRSGGSYSSSSRSSYSSSSSSRSYSSPSSSRSSYSSSSSSRSYSSPSSTRSSYSSSSSSRSYSSPSSSRSSYSGSSSSRSDYSSSRSGVSSDNYLSRTSSRNVASEIRSRTGSVPAGTRGSGSAVRGNVDRGTTPTSGRGSATQTSGRPSGVAPAPANGYARPNNPGGVIPPSHRPMHPAPYFWHPHHHCMVHCHPLYWDPFPPRPYYWPGFWLYCNSYWYDYHVSDVIVVREYVKESYKMDLITYAISGDYMYALVDDPDGHTYIQIYDQNDKLLAEQQVSRKYCKMEVDQQNGGCWIMKKHDKDPLLFFYTNGELLIYEADK